MSKDRISAVVAEAVGEEEAKPLRAMKKGEAAAAAERLLDGKGWGPELMRPRLSSPTARAVLMLARKLTTTPNNYRLGRVPSIRPRPAETIMVDEKFQVAVQRLLEIGTLILRDWESTPWHGRLGRCFTGVRTA